MIEQYLWIAGSTIFLLLGTLHLLYTFFTNKFSARDANVVSEMKKTYPILTRQTTMWKAWIGFNAGHSIGAMFFGIINIVIAGQYLNLLKGSYSLLILNFCVSLFYLFLAKKYWFRTPLTGILVANCCFAASITLILLK